MSNAKLSSIKKIINSSQILFDEYTEIPESSCEITFDKNTTKIYTFPNIFISELVLSFQSNLPHDLSIKKYIKNINIFLSDGELLNINGYELCAILSSDKTNWDNIIDAHKNNIYGNININIYKLLFINDYVPFNKFSIKLTSNVNCVLKYTSKYIQNIPDYSFGIKQYNMLYEVLKKNDTYSFIKNTCLGKEYINNLIIDSFGSKIESISVNHNMFKLALVNGNSAYGIIDKSLNIRGNYYFSAFTIVNNNINININGDYQLISLNNILNKENKDIKIVIIVQLFNVMVYCNTNVGMVFSPLKNNKKEKDFYYSTKMNDLLNYKIIDYLNNNKPKIMIKDKLDKIKNNNSKVYVKL